MKINMYTKAFYLLTNEICSKYVISVKFSICEYKKVAVQPYSGDELCSAISWKNMESGIDTIQCKISCSHIFERISIALLKVKSILWALWVGRFSPLRQCVLRTHMHTAVTAGLYYISPGHDILSLDFTIFIGPRSNHSLPMSLTHWLTNSLNDDLVEDWINWPKHADYADYADQADYAD